MQTDVYISLGSNLGDTSANLRRARAEVSGLEYTEIVAVGDERITEPVGVTDQPPFRNQVLRLRTSLEPSELLRRLLEIEDRMGRVRVERWGPRVIDLDVLFYGRRRIDSPKLTVPHPELANRPFFLEMVAELDREFLRSWEEFDMPGEDDGGSQEQE